jgi:hypothetical protein
VWLFWGAQLVCMSLDAALAVSIKSHLEHIGLLLLLLLLLLLVVVMVVVVVKGDCCWYEHIRLFVVLVCAKGYEVGSEASRSSRQLCVVVRGCCSSFPAAHPQHSAGCAAGLAVHEWVNDWFWVCCKTWCVYMISCVGLRAQGRGDGHRFESGCWYAHTLHAWLCIDASVGSILVCT